MDMSGFVRVAAGRPLVRPGDVKGNLESVKRIVERASSEGVEMLVLPELCLTGATCGDLFFQGSLLDAADAALKELAAFAVGRGMLIVAGLPVRCGGALFNAAAVIDATGVAAFVPKSSVAEEARWFSGAERLPSDTVEFGGKDVPFKADAVFAPKAGGFTFKVTIGEDGAGASGCALSPELVLVPSAMPAVAGVYGRMISSVKALSSKSLAAFAVSGAGCGESSSTAVFAGESAIVECGDVLAEGVRFERGEGLTVADVDMGYLAFRRRRAARGPVCAQERVIKADFATAGDKRGLFRKVDAHPFIPSGEAERRERCAEIFRMQSSALATRLEAIRCRDVVIGLSGGLDSALALLVSVEAFGMLGLDIKGIHVLTMPGFGTTGRTKGNAELLAEGLGLEIETVDITPLVRQHFKDIGQDESVRDVTYENAQARARTYVLMDRANQVGGIVIGTGDLSELALGWCTFNGDHMSMYGVNAGLPKTLIRHMAAWYAGERGGKAGDALLDILATPVSPELLPGVGGEIAQKTEDSVGPYELHDFFLYHFIGRGAERDKILMLAAKAFEGVYVPETVSRWLDVFMRRFFTQQFKRSCTPDGPSVGRISLSPFGGWEMASDAVAPQWAAGRL